MIVRHVLIGGLFTMVGLVSLLIPAFPVICIGALIFGPIELMIGLFAEDRRGRVSAPLPALTIERTADASRKTCGSCGFRSDPAAAFCANCGAPYA